MAWQPDLASPDLEKAMEAADLPEGDRDEVRRFREYLWRKKERALGNPLRPMPEEMIDWLRGQDAR